MTRAKSCKAIIAWLRSIKAHGWKDANGNPVDPEVAAEAARILRAAWGMR